MLEETLHRFNPWWVRGFASPGIHRPDYIRRIQQTLDMRKIVILFGLRRVGKSTIMKQYVAQALDTMSPQRIYFTSMDHPEMERTPIMNILRECRRLTSARTDEDVLLLLDEIQHRDGFEKEIKAIIDTEENVKIVASGSSSLALGHASPYLTGRYNRIPVRPLSFREFLLFRSQEYMPHEPHLMESLANEYLLTGGMPEYVITGDPQMITNLVEDVIFKDICSRYDVHDPKLLKEFYYLLMTRVGNRLSFSKMGRLVDMSVDTARRYTGYFEEAFLLDTIERAGSPNVRKASPKKCYAPDTGIRAVITGENNVGSLAENAVYLRLKEEGSVSYILEKEGEIDFLVAGKAVEVKYRDVIEREHVSCLSAYKGRQVKTKYVVTRGDGPKIGNVRRVSLWRFIDGTEQT